MKKLVLITFLIIMGYTSQVSAQGFTPPSTGKAVVYFARISAYGFAVAFDFYLNDKFIGAFKGENYMRYEFEPGEQLIWGAGENIEFLPSNLKEGDRIILKLLNIVSDNLPPPRLASSPPLLKEEGKLTRHV